MHITYLSQKRCTHFYKSLSPLGLSFTLAKPCKASYKSEICMTERSFVSTCKNVFLSSYSYLSKLNRFSIPSKIVLHAFLQNRKLYNLTPKKSQGQNWISTFSGSYWCSKQNHFHSKKKCKISLNSLYNPEICNKIAKFRFFPTQTSTNFLVYKASPYLQMYKSSYRTNVQTFARNDLQMQSFALQEDLYRLPHKDLQSSCKKFYKQKNLQGYAKVKNRLKKESIHCSGTTVLRSKTILSGEIFKENFTDIFQTNREQVAFSLQLHRRTYQEGYKNIFWKKLRCLLNRRLPYFATTKIVSSYRFSTSTSKLSNTFVYSRPIQMHSFRALFYDKSPLTNAKICKQMQSSKLFRAKFCFSKTLQIRNLYDKYKFLQKSRYTLGESRLLQLSYKSSYNVLLCKRAIWRTSGTLSIQNRVVTNLRFVIARRFRSKSFCFIPRSLTKQSLVKSQQACKESTDFLRKKICQKSYNSLSPKGVRFDLEKPYEFSCKASCKAKLCTTNTNFGNVACTNFLASTNLRFARSFVSTCTCSKNLNLHGLRFCKSSCKKAVQEQSCKQTNKAEQKFLSKATTSISLNIKIGDYLSSGDKIGKKNFRKKTKESTSILFLHPQFTSTNQRFVKKFVLAKIFARKGVCIRFAQKIKLYSSSRVNKENIQGSRSNFFAEQQMQSFALQKQQQRRKETRPIVLNSSGRVISISKTQLILQKTQPILFYNSANLHVKKGEWVNEGSPILTLTHQTLITGDIVQGIPRIEQLFEAFTSPPPAFKDKQIFTKFKDVHETLHSQVRDIFRKHWLKNALPIAVRKSLEEIGYILVEMIQKVYLSQGVLIADKHIEIIIRQLASKGQVLDSGTTGLFLEEVLPIRQIENANLTTPGKKCLYVPAVMGLTAAALNSDSFISAASFQETTRVLSRDAVIGKSDFLRGLKEKVVIGDLISAGTGLDIYFIYTTILAF